MQGGRFTRQMMMLREMIRSPKQVGAVCASSQGLARAMARLISPPVAGSGDLVVELGAGTGVVTEALLERGVAPENLIVVECSPTLADYLKERFPKLDIRCCGAEELAGMTDDRPVTAIVSSLPFRSLPRQVSLDIMTAIKGTLAPGGLYVQFTYALVGPLPFVPTDFAHKGRRFVFTNLPPAKVEVYMKKPEVPQKI